MSEPVAWRWQHINDRREPRPWHYETAPWHGNEYMQAEPLYAATPVRVEPTSRDTFYSILKNYIPGESIDQAWQELREAGLVP